MGVDFYAYAVIGVKIDKEQLIERRVVKTFDHDYPESMHFDPQTGRRLWEEQECLKSGVADDGDFDGDWSDVEVCGFPLICGTDFNPAIVGFCSAGADAEGGDAYHAKRFEKLPDDIDAKKQLLRDALEPLGLWDESKFGLYAVPYVSY